MSMCPEIDVLLSETARKAARDHLDECGACAAIAELAEVRRERLDGRDEQCLEAEVSIALLQVGELEDAEKASLQGHLERCAGCNEIAVRTGALLALPGGDAEQNRALAATSRQRVRPGQWVLGLAAAAGVGLALGFGVAGSGSTEATRAAPEPPAALPAGNARAVAPPESPVASAAPDTTTARAPVGYVSLTCVPGCEIFEGDVSLGRSPLVRHAASVGAHHYTLREKGIVRSVSLEVKEGATTARRIALGGAEVIDPWGAPTAKSPGGKGALGKDELINPFADPAPTGTGFLTVVCTPGCDEVILDGQSLGPSPVARTKVTSGAHHLVLKRAAQQQYRRVVVAPGRTLTVRVDMTRGRDSVVDPWD